MIIPLLEKQFNSDILNVYRTIAFEALFQPGVQEEVEESIRAS